MKALTVHNFFFHSFILMLLLLLPSLYSALPFSAFYTSVFDGRLYVVRNPKQYPFIAANLYSSRTILCFFLFVRLLLLIVQSQ